MTNVKLEFKLKQCVAHHKKKKIKIFSKSRNESEKKKVEKLEFHVDIGAVE